MRDRNRARRMEGRRGGEGSVCVHASLGDEIREIEKQSAHTHVT